MKDIVARAMHFEDLGKLKNLLPQLQDLKRQQPAHYKKSIASSLFIESWERLFYGEEPEEIALKITAKALLALVLPGCDAHFFKTANIDRESAENILKSAFSEQISGEIDANLYGKLFDEIPKLIDEFYDVSEFDQKSGDFSQKTTDFDPKTGDFKGKTADFKQEFWFVEALCCQPRAGATKPGLPRLLLVPPEMHSDHCLITAVYAVLLSSGFYAEVGLPFLTGLSHHLHNAVLPDCGFAGEIALGEHLQPIIENSIKAALKNVNKTETGTIRQAITNHENLENAEGQSSSAADVLDRVLDIKWRVRAASVTEKEVLDDLELVHDGPIKSFQTEVLKSVLL